MADYNKRSAVYGSLAYDLDALARERQLDDAGKPPQRPRPQAQQEAQAAEISAEKRSQVGMGMRNEKIRTYNFPQSRVTDHRIGLTLYKLGEILDGNLDEIIDALATREQAEKLRKLNA